MQSMAFYGNNAHNGGGRAHILKKKCCVEFEADLEPVKLTLATLSSQAPWKHPAEAPAGPHTWQMVSKFCYLVSVLLRSTPSVFTDLRINNSAIAAAWVMPGREPTAKQSGCPRRCRWRPYARGDQGCTAAVLGTNSFGPRDALGFAF